MKAQSSDVRDFLMRIGTVINLVIARELRTLNYFSCVCVHTMAGPLYTHTRVYPVHCRYRVHCTRVPGTLYRVTHTVRLLNNPGLQPNFFRFRWYRRSFLSIDRNLQRITNPVSDLTGTSSSVYMWFFEIVILEITIRFFKFVWEILPTQTTIQPREWHIIMRIEMFTQHKKTRRNSIGFWK